MMNKRTHHAAFAASFCALATVSVLVPIADADAQRRGGGGGRASMSRPSGGSFGGASSRQVRSSASSSLNYGGGGRGTQWANASNRPSTGNINSGNRTNINRGNINTGDVNIDRDVHVDVDGGYGCCGNGDWDYHPVAAGVAIGTAVAVTNAWRVGAYYSTLPTNCVVVYRATVTYYQCGTYWYQPVYSGMSVQYVAVVAP